MLIANMSGEKNPENKDLLGHKVYVDQILDKITKNKPDFKKESFVIGLEGEWGIGKTWILDKLECKLKKDSKFKNNLIRLDSWTSFGYKYFIENYYKELRNKSLKSYERLWDKAFNGFFNQVINELDKETSLQNIGILVNLLAISLATAGGWFTLSNLNVDGGLVILIVGILYILFKLIKFFLNENKSYSQIKKDICRKISTKFKDEPLVVIIDDLDRSDSEDIKQILKLVKSDANFANVIYILSYDRKIIEGKIKDEADFFFDKIVQLPITVKIPDKQKLKQYFLEKINALLDKYTYSQKDLQDKYLGDLLFDSRLFDLFKDLRMIDKFLLSFENELNNQKGYIGYDICLGDLAFIEFIRIFDNAVYEYIKNDPKSWQNKLAALKDEFLFEDIKTVFVGERLNIYIAVINYCFRQATQFRPPDYSILMGKVNQSDREAWVSYFSSTILGDSEITSQTKIFDLLDKEINVSLLKEFVEGKDIRNFCITLNKTIKSKKDIFKIIIPLVELGDIYGLPDNQRSYILTFLKNYYENNSEAKPDFIDLVESDSVATLAHFLARYKIDSKDSQVTNMYKLSPDEWGKVGDKIHARFKKEWEKILELDDFDFTEVIFRWRDLVNPKQFEELKKIIAKEFQISTSKKFQKNKFINIIKKFQQLGAIFDIKKGQFKRKSQFPYKSYNYLNNFVPLEKVKAVIEKHDLYSEAEICTDFIDGWDNRDADPFKKGWR